MTWFKLHHEIIDDIKIRRFTSQEKWAWVVLLSLASKSSDRGKITADNEDLADYCEFNSTQDWLYYRDKLVAKGMLEINELGGLTIVHWDERQAKKPSDDPARVKERVAKSRAKRKNETPSQSQEDVTRYKALQSQSNADVSPMSRGREEEIRSDQIRLEKTREEKEKNKETFFSDSLDQNQEAMQELKSSIAIAKKENPTPLPPAPLSDAAIALKAKFEAKFDRKANKYEPQGLTIAGYGEWHLGGDYNNWKPSLIAVAQKRKRDLNQDESLSAACDFIYNIARDCYREKHWGKFKNLTAAAIAYEQALAANPTQSQDVEPTEPIVYDHDCRWEHYYPMKGKVNPKTDEAEIIWGMINSRPPDPVDERCQKFLVKANGDTEKLTKLLKATHTLERDVASYQIQSENFANAKDGLIAALNQEIQKILSTQAV